MWWSEPLGPLLSTTSSRSSGSFPGILVGLCVGADGYPGSATTSPTAQQMHSSIRSPIAAFIIPCTSPIAIQRS